MEEEERNNIEWLLNLPIFELKTSISFWIFKLLIILYEGHH